MKRRGHLRLLAIVACFLCFSPARAAIQDRVAKLPTNDGWEKIVFARIELNEALKIPTTNHPRELEPATKLVVERAARLSRSLDDFIKSNPTNINAFAALMESAFAAGIEGILGKAPLLEAVETVTGLEYESTVVENFPALNPIKDSLREAAETNLIFGAMAALRFQPTNQAALFPLLELAQKSKSDAAKLLVRALIAGKQLPATWLEAATNILTRQYAIGRPFETRITTMDGLVIETKALRGKVLLINFWATTCGPCLREMPELKSLHTRFHDQGFEILGVSLDDEATPVEKVLKEKGATWPNAVDFGWPTNGLGKQCGVFAIPNNWLVDRKGILREIAAREKLAAKVALLIAEPN